MRAIAPRAWLMLGSAWLALGSLGFAQGSRPASRPASRPDARPETHPASAPASKPVAAEPEKPKEEEFVAIVNGDVETVTMGRLKGATILIKGSKIWKVGRNIDIPEDAKRIDAAGLRVYPGLVAARAQNIGVTGFGGGGRIADRYDPFSLDVLGTLAAGITTVMQSDAVMKILTKGIDDLTVRENAVMRLQFGTGQQRLELRERLERARAYLLDSREFEAKKAAGDKDAKDPSKDGVDMNLVRLLRREVPARFEVDRAEDMLPILQLLDDYRFDCVFSGCLEAWAIANDLSRRGVRCILSPRRRQPRDERRETPTGSSPEAATILKKAGVEFAFYPPPGFDGGDIISWDGIAGRDLQTLALDGAWAVRGGLDEPTALEAITITPARILGVDHRIGSIEPGKDADLILLDGPIFDFRTFTQMAIVNGEIQYEKAKVSLFSHIRPRSVPVSDVPAYPETKPKETSGAEK